MWSYPRDSVIYSSFKSIWDFMFSMLDNLVTFGNKVVDVMMSPFTSLVDVEWLPPSFITRLINFLDWLGIVDADVTVFEFVMVTLVPILLVTSIVKSFLDVL